MMYFKEIPSLYGLRALSVLLVINHHLSVQHNWFQSSFGLKWLTFEFIKDGQIGVTIFFVISGFLITTLLIQEERTNQEISLKKFYIRRSLRIFPAYYFLLLVYFLLQSVQYLHIPFDAWLTALTYTKYLNWDSDWYTAHAWSLSIEEQFYIFWPIVFKYLRNHRILIATLVSLASPSIRLLSFFYANDLFNDLTIFTRVDAISIGCLLAIFQKRIITGVSKYWKVLFIASLFLLFSMRYIMVVLSRFGIGGINPMLLGSFGTITIFLICFILLYSCFGPKRIWYYFLNSKPMVFLGKISYSLYLWQQLFLIKTNWAINQLPYSILYIFIMSIFSFYLIEKPFNVLKSRFKTYNA